jgi:radical SAM enzyme (TIGR01210 family)
MYPTLPHERDQWILSRRGERNLLDEQRAFHWCAEEEPDHAGGLKNVTTIFLTNRECPFRCVMCDLWKNTLTSSVSEGSIVGQVKAVIEHAPETEWLKLYNSGSFFDPRAIPREDYEPVAALLQGMSRLERVIVESHPAFLNESCLRFRDMIGRKLEVAIGLETAREDALEKLNKRMTLDQFEKAGAFLWENGIDLRVFLLAPPPFVEESQRMLSVQSSVEYAFDQHASVVSLIPTRATNGAMEELAREGQFQEPSLGELERALEKAFGSKRGRVFADLWDLEKFSDCPHCFEARRLRLERMNLEQRSLPALRCEQCLGN